MRHQSVITSVSWIPSEGIPGASRVPFLLGMAHYDEPPPDRLVDLEDLRAADRFRFANELSAWIEVDGDRIVDAGYDGDVWMGGTMVHVGRRTATVPGVTYPTLQRAPEHGDGWVRFVQTCGGRTGVPIPRHVARRPWFQVTAPTVWTTLALTLHVDGHVDHEVVGASPFPRHWFYDAAGGLVHKTATLDFRTWAGASWGPRSPWGDHEEAVAVAAAETDLERLLSPLVMRAGTRPRIRRLRAGTTLTEQGAPGLDVYLLLDGLLDVEVDGLVVAEVGPGSILGERARLEDGRRTATLRARTPVVVAVAGELELGPAVLEAIAAGHHRGEGPAQDTGASPGHVVVDDGP